jgi:diguanylate cyclase (GGDEF)-like protein
MGADQGSMPDHDQHQEDEPFTGGINLRLLRARLWLALLSMFVIPLAITAPIFNSMAGARGESLIMPTIALGFVACCVGVLATFLAHRVLEPAEQLNRAQGYLREAYERAREESLLDPLTGLGNHRAFQEELGRQLSSAARYHHSVALVIVDLDDFKQVNDTHGHAAGDDLLATVARAFLRGIRRPDRAFRVGGDEFAILMPHTDAKSASIPVSRILVAALESPHVAANPHFSFTAGISDFPGLSHDRETLYRQADAALYWGKRHGRTLVEVFDPAREGAELGARPVAERSAAVERTATRRLLRAVFQPIVDLVDGRVIGYEGLVRPLPESGFLDPGSLFTVAEACGRTVELDMACLETVTSAAARLGLTGYLSLNLSPRTVESDEFGYLAVTGVLARHGIEPERVVIELTERETIENVDRLRRKLEQLRGEGIRIAADDVGAGNAGLRLLSHVRFDVVKIDLSLVQGGAAHGHALEVLRSVHDLADRWGATVVAEGVESADQLRVVRSLGLDSAQGYLLGRPEAEPRVEAVDLDELTANVPMPRWALPESA